MVELILIEIIGKNISRIYQHRKGERIMTNKEKLESLESSIMDELASITDPQVLNAKLQALYLIAQIKKMYQG